MARMNGAEAMVASLEGYGVDTVFTLPGGQLNHLLEVIYPIREKMRVIHTRHEQGAAYMAYGYAKSTGKVGTFAVVPGPGLLNATAALCTAYSNYARVLCISGQIPSTSMHKHYGDLHEIDDQLGLIRHLTKWAERIEHPADVPGRMQEIFKQLLTGCPRPVEVEMPMDMMSMETEVATLKATTEYKQALPDEDLVKQAAKILGKAKRPLIVVGGGAVDAADEILALAEELQAPVMSKRNGKGIVSAEHYLSANIPMGHNLWGQADAVLAIGSRLRAPLLFWGKDEEMKLIRVDIEPGQLERICKPEVALLGDARVVVNALNKHVCAYNHKRASRKEELDSLKAGIESDMRESVAMQMAYLDVIRQELPEDGIFVDEVTQVGFASWYGFPVYRPRQHITAGYQGTLGFGFATALGVVAAHPDKKVVQVSGDGGFMFNVQELSTAVHYQLPLVTIIFNDERFTNVQRQQQEWFEGHVFCSDLHNPDFVKLAECFGAAGFSANNPEELRLAINSAFKEKGPCLIEVRINEFFPRPWKFIQLPQNRKHVCV